MIKSLVLPDNNANDAYFDVPSADRARNTNVHLNCAEITSIDLQGATVKKPCHIRTTKE